MTGQGYDIFIDCGPWGDVDQHRVRVMQDAPLDYQITLPNPPKGHRPTGTHHPVTPVPPDSPNSNNYKRAPEMENPEKINGTILPQGIPTYLLIDSGGWPVGMFHNE
ncbi:MAG TPA: hypothetical protein VGH89_04175 [Pseudonocardia sp.]|jgi:hypothetical protein